MLRCGRTWARACCDVLQRAQVHAVMCYSMRNNPAPGVFIINAKRPAPPTPSYNAEARWARPMGTAVPCLVLLYYNRQTGTSMPRAELGRVHSVGIFFRAAGGRLV